MANDYKTPGAESGGSADVAKSFAAGFGAQDLRAQTGYPTYCPQRLLVTNANAAVQSVIFKDRNGNTITMPVGANATTQFDIAASTLEAGGGANISVVVAWWTDSTSRFN